MEFGIGNAECGMRKINGKKLRSWDDKKRDAGRWKRDDKDGMVKTWMIG